MSRRGRSTYAASPISSLGSGFTRFPGGLGYRCYAAGVPANGRAEEQRVGLVRVQADRAFATVADPA
jgi:hypothetical protein